MEKRVLLAALLSALLLSWYSQAIMKWQASPSSRSGAAPIATESKAETRANPATAFLEQEERLSVIESNALRAEIGTRSAAIRRVVLKSFSSGGHPQLMSFSGPVALAGVDIGDGLRDIRLLSESSKEIVFQATSGDEDYHISFSLEDDNSLVNIKIHSLNQIDELHNPDIRLVNSWQKADDLGNRYNNLEIYALAATNGDKKKHKHYVGSPKTSKNVPRGTFLLALSERYFCQVIKPESGSLSVTVLPHHNGMAVTSSSSTMSKGADGRGSFSAQIYFGPRDFFYLRREGIPEAFPIGVLGQIGLILLMVLNWIAGFTKNYGVAVILLSALITCAMAPFTLLGYRSMRKMQELKPRIDHLMAKHKEDMKKAQREVMALYKEHRISPLSGCLPLLLQMPIFIALFQAISHFIELRGAKFLWIADLSLPDRLWRLPFSIPFIGEHLNVLPIVMAVLMYLQSKMSQSSMATDQNNPTAKLMSGPTMSIVFGIMFYQFPAGLVLYWLTNSATSLILYRFSTPTATVQAKA